MACKLSAVLSKSEAEQLYSRDKLSIRDIAVRYATTGTTVRRLLSEYGIPLRPNGRALKKEDHAKRNKRPKKVGSSTKYSVLTKDVLLQEVEAGETASSIARKYGAHPGTVTRLLKIHDVEFKRTPVYAAIGHDRLMQMYVERQMSTSAIAAELNVDAQAVVYALKHYDIDVRELSDYRQQMFLDAYPHLTAEHYHNFSSVEWWDQQLRNMSPSQLALDLNIPYANVISRTHSLGITASDYGWVDTYSEGAIQRLLDQLGVEYRTRVRDVIPPQEIDVYIPGYNLGIEVNGEYWHCDKFDRITPNYHQQKTLAANSKGVKLFHIWDREIKDARTWNILADKIRHAVHMTSNTVYARRTVVERLSTSAASEFYNKTHIQGAGPNYKYHWGLVYDGVLVAAMSGNVVNDHMYLGRYSTVTDTSVVGGFTKLLSHYLKSYHIKAVDTYCNGRFFSDSNVYTAAGFVSSGWTSPGYTYHKNGRIITRQQAQRKHLPNLLGADYNPTLTEEANMLLAGYYRLYDCGHVKYRLTIGE